MNLPPLDKLNAALARSMEPARVSPEKNRLRRGAEEAAVGMEGLFVSLLLKQMRQALEPGSLFGSDNGDVLGGLFDATMGQHLARSGGLGIGNLLKQQWAGATAQTQVNRLG